MKKQRGTKADEPFMNMTRETARIIGNMNAPAISKEDLMKKKKEKNMNKAIIKRSYKGIEEDLIYRNTAVGYYFPLENTVSVYDRETDNVIVEEGMAYPGEPRHPETRRYTVSPTVLDRIRKAIVKSDVLNIKSFESSEFCVYDGEYNCFYFSADGKRKYIDCDNFYLLYKGCTKDSNAGKVMRLIDRIEDILDKENCD